MVTRYILPLALAGLAGACARTTTESELTVAPGTALAASHLQANPAGKAVFDEVCSRCHTIDAPAKLAPPMSHVARHYRIELGSETAGRARISQWVRGPAAERSLLPAHAIERWGVMPPVSLSDDQIEAVAGYVWSLGTVSSMGGMGAGMPGRGDGGMGQAQGMGRGMMMRHGRGGMGQDTMRSHVHGGMGQGQGGMGQGMMMRGAMGQDTMRSHIHRGMGQGMMGQMCPMRTMQPDTSSTRTE